MSRVLKYIPTNYVSMYRKYNIKPEFKIGTTSDHAVLNEIMVHSGDKVIYRRMMCTNLVTRNILYQCKVGSISSSRVRTLK